MRLGVGMSPIIERHAQAMRRPCAGHGQESWGRLVYHRTYNVLGPRIMVRCKLREQTSASACSTLTPLAGECPFLTENCLSPSPKQW
jgi:hypothetical protein